MQEDAKNLFEKIHLKDKLFIRKKGG